MRKLIVTILIFSVTIIYADFKFNYLNFDIGQNFSRIWNSDETIQYKTNQLIYPQINVELMSLDFPNSNSILNSFSLETCALLGLKESEFFKENQFIYRANVGMTISSPSSLKYKSGTRYLSILLSGGTYSEFNGTTIGCQFISKYRRSENRVDEAVYLKYYVYYDTMENEINQVRGGVSIAYNFPRLNGETFKLLKGTTTPKKMWRNRSLYFLVIGALINGAGYYFNEIGDGYYDDYQNAVTSNDAVKFRNNAENAYDIRTICYYTSITPLIYSLISWFKYSSID